jgi:hypothetical protein
MKAQLAGIAAIAMIAGTTQSQVLNPSFENPGFPNVFDNWDQFGGNIGPDLDELILDGDVSVKIFGDFSGFFNVKGIFQTTNAAAPGDSWEASVNVGHLTGDELQPGARAFVSLVYRDAAGVNIYDAATDILLPSSPTDTFILGSATDVAPLGTADVQIVVGFVQEEATSDTNGDTFIDGGDQAGGAAHYDLAAVTFQSAGNAIPFRNGSFEEGIFGRAFESWTSFGNAGQNFEVPNSDGDASCLMFGQFSGVANDTVAFQGVPAAVGENWEASVKVRPNPGDEPAEGNTATLSLVFLDGSGNVLSDNPVPAADHTTSSAAFIDVSVSAVAPAGTAEAQIVLVYSQGEPLSDVNGDTIIDGADQPVGAIIFDEANLQLAASGTDCCDINGDGSCSATDFSAWINAFNNSLPTCDVNQDGSCTPTDFSAWINAFNASTGGAALQCNF